MLFNSFAFIFFLLGVILVYFSLPQRWRVWFLLAASYYFYICWKWQYIFLIITQTGINYYCGYKIGTSQDNKVRKLWVSIAIILSIGLLGYYKYFNFFNDSFSGLFNALGMNYMIPHLDILLPVGISFFTFQTLSYSIDVYRKKCDVDLHIGRFSLYVAFFPQLVAGPIERASHLLGQFKRHNHFDIDRFTAGSKLIIWGLFKKVVIADRLAIFVNQIYSSPEDYSGATLLLATFFFAFQIYCDFSAYSDIAIGSAKILGYDLMQNFNLPYFSKSISEFWRRWHISLSSWFSDYVYIPLGGNRTTKIKWLRNIAIVFLVSGLWHGANWTFIVWGALHGTYYFTESIYKMANKRIKARLLPKKLSSLFHMTTVFILVLIAWVFFRANSISDATLILQRIFTNMNGILYLGPSTFSTFLSMLFIILLLIIQYFQYSKLASLYFSPSRFPAWCRIIGYSGLLLLIALFGVSSSEFIYFQF